MAFENMNVDEGVDLNGTPPPGQSSNRPFLIAAGILGGIAVVTLICIALYALWWRPLQDDKKATQAAAVNAQNTEVAAIMTQTSSAPKTTFTPTATRPLNTATPKPTSVVIIPTNTQSVTTVDPRTATVAALLTKAALTTKTVVPTATQAMPPTGLIEDIGLPTLLGAAVLLLVVIFLARRLRTSH